jgi:endoglucanase
MSTHGLQWFPWGDCLKDASLQSLASDWGADILRVSMYIQEDGWLSDKAKHNGMLDNIVNAATAKGMYVLIDFHLLTPGDPMANLENAKEFFERVVPLHGPKGNVLFEIANEPNGVPWSRIKEYADQIIPLIRRHDKKSPILVGTMAWSSLGVSGQGPWSQIASAPLSDANTLYVVHFYAGEHKDAYRTAVRAAAPASNVVNLMDALRRSVAADKGAAPKAAPRKAKKGKQDDVRRQPQFKFPIEGGKAKQPKEAAAPAPRAKAKRKSA